MEIAYIILAHKNPGQLHRLVARLDAAHTHIFIHVDLGTKAEIYSEMQKMLGGFSSVHWLPRLHSQWGSWRLVQATLSGLEQAVQADCDYVLLLSGQDYPIKPLGALRAFLENNNGLSFLQYFQLPSLKWPPDGDSRYIRWHFNLGWKNSSLRKLANRFLNRTFNTLFLNRELPNGLAPYGGSQWWCLHRDSMNYILEFSRKESPVVNFFQHVRISDEMYFHTILLNSHQLSTIINRSLTYVDWNGPPYPRVLKSSDYNDLITADCFYARKFDKNIDDEILELLDRSIGEENGNLA